MKNFHDFTVIDINGKSASLDSFKGKKVLVVNVASECGLTPQYSTLQELQNEFSDKDFTVVGFPANNFGGQEPGTEEEIKTFCTTHFGVTFPMMAKISVIGPDQHELYQWLTQKAKNGKEDVEVTWNFQKFLIDEEGNYVGYIAPADSPADERIINWINS